MSHIKRLTKEIANYTKTFKTISISDTEQIIVIEEDGAYLYVNNFDITSLKALVIGPKDTSYEDGFYVFDIKIPDTYPFEPPSVKHLTTDGRVRMNPNLYEGGKVCLSILGTWSGPAWSSLMNISVVLNYLRMIMNEDPLRNEPGYSDPDKNKDKAAEYNQYVAHENMRYAILEVHHVNKFPVFRIIIDDLFEKKKEKFITKVTKNSESIPKKKLTTTYGHTLNIDWIQILSKFSS